jgi:outer membrane receptor for ferrienterochelin and colicin
MLRIARFRSADSEVARHTKKKKTNNNQEEKQVMNRQIAFAIGVSCLAPAAMASHDGNSEVVEELIVYGRAQELLGTANAASEGVVGFDDILLSPILRVGELVEAVPGMVATQHSGTGKANQYFLRGFNLDHGTDFSAFVDGVPINMRTHGHGQGYLDLNFFIPELVQTTTYRKGPYSPLVGDFSSAGSVDFRLVDSLEEGSINATVGSYDYYRVTGMSGFDALGGTMVAAADYTTYASPWEIDEDLRQTKFYLSYKTDIGNAVGRVSMLGYSGEWNSTDQIPERAVASGLIDERGFIDPDLGGHTDRYGITGDLTFEDWKITAYLVDYDFGLYSNFTYLLEDPVNGDQFEQMDKRQVYGLRVDGAQEWITGFLPMEFSWGGDVRVDDIGDVGLFRTVERERIGTVRQDSVDQMSVGGYGDLAMRLSDSLRVSLGLRADYFDWDVRSDLAPNSGSGDDYILSPKFNAAFRATDNMELYLNWGQGFHSNDARGTTITIDPVSGEPAEQVDPLVQSTGAEVGVRFEAGERANATLTAFWLELDSELLFVGDAGATEALGASERVGFELATFWQLNDWAAANFNYTYTDSQFKVDEGAGQEIPGAFETSASLGLTGAWSNGMFASLRARYLGEAPLIEDNSVRSDPSLLVNAGLGYRMESFEFRLEVFNLFDSNDTDIAYFYASRLEGEPLAGVEDIHYRPLEPRTARFSVSFNW